MSLGSTRATRTFAGVAVTGGLILSALGVAAPAQAAEPTISGDGDTLTQGAPRSAVAASGGVDNDLFSIDVTEIELTAGIGHRDSGTSTFTAKRDILVSTPGLPGTPTSEYGGTLSGVCPYNFTAVVMHAGDTCTLEYFFAPESNFSLGAAGWHPTATPIAADGTPEGDPIEESVGATGTVLTLAFGDIDLGTVQSGDTATVTMEVTNLTAIDLPLLGAADLPGGLAPTSEDQFPLTVPAGQTVSVPLSYTATWPGTPDFGFFIEADVPVPSWGTPGPTSYYVRAHGTVLPAPLHSTDADFGEVKPGSTSERTITVTNTGSGWAWITATLDDATAGEVEIDPFDSYFEPGQSTDITVRWTPKDDAAVASDGLATITFDDMWAQPDQPRTAVSRLTGARAPVDPVTPVDPETPVGPVTPTDPNVPADPTGGHGADPVAARASHTSTLALTGADLGPTIWAVPLTLLALGGIALTIGTRRLRPSAEHESR